MRAFDRLARAFVVCVIAAFATGVASANGIIEVTWRKAQFLPIEGDPATIIIGDPSITDISIEGQGKIVIFGKVPGETSLMVLGANGDVLLDTAVVVTPENERHVSIISPSASAYTERTWNCAGRCVQVVGPGTIDYKAPARAASGPAAGGTPSPQAVGAAETAGGIQSMNKDASQGANAVAGQSNMMVTP